QREAAAGEVVDRGREVELAVEPRLDRVLVGRGDVREMAGHEGPHVAREHLVGKPFPPRAIRGELPAPRRHDRQGRGNGEGTPRYATTPRSQARLRAQAGSDASAQGVRHLVAGELLTQRCAQPPSTLLNTGAVRADS